jgi:xylulose-5-phosphate/fructose-6-phosphate phosphoketolase
MDSAIKHCTKGIGIWDWASNDDSGDSGGETDIVMASCGDVPTREALAAVAILREEFPKLKVRFVNVVDLMKLMPSTEHPHGLTDKEFDSLFTSDKHVIFNFHGYPWLIHKLTYKRTNQERIHVRGYKERGNINTPLELAIKNQIDRFDLVIDVIDRLKLGSKGAHVRERMKNEIIDNIQYAYDNGVDKDEINNWKWPF